ncbi:hypothetical protein [Pseudomonas koreensis]|uniref:hypothetical protein n=1 Tax=Pseudomonas koreensis TaxID=198620 RepID=UPI002076DB7B|nr:hypothetical protein [Pseudomonas koreensis]MCM8743592.1 hypothetical protein [Pseudomonas koreensis]
MSKHTPGPWRSGKWGASIIANTPVKGGINGSDAVESYGGHLIAESISECNMSLIIAAPDLLAAAIKVLNGLNERIDSATENRTATPVFDGIADLHDAINKATA